MTRIGDYPQLSLRQRAEARAAERLAAIQGGAVFRTSHPQYTLEPEHNLVPGVDIQDFREDLSRAAGGELMDTPEAPAKFCAAFSSSALAVNAFGPFRKSTALLHLAGHACFRDACFEKTLPTGLLGTPPHLDFYAKSDSAIVCVESKFLEPLWPKTAKFADSYDKAMGELAEPRWATLYEDLKSQPHRFRHLDAAQLVKHYLGMRNTLDDFAGELTLLYVFWAPENAEEISQYRLHRDEVAAFSNDVMDGDVRFVAMSYDQLWNAWQGNGSDEINAHVNNLLARYAFSV